MPPTNPFLAQGMQVVQNFLIQPDPAALRNFIQVDQYLAISPYAKDWDNLLSVHTTAFNDRIISHHKAVPLNHPWYLCRHGKSVPNERKIIISTQMFGGLDVFGLTEGGHSEAERSLGEWADSIPEIFEAARNNRLRIYSGPLSRHSQTASLLAFAGGVDPAIVNIREELNDRQFGPFYENQPDIGYRGVYESDSINPFHQRHFVESVDHLISRVLAFIFNEDTRMKPGEIGVIVSSGDPLMALIAAYQHKPASEFCKVEKPGNAAPIRLIG